MNDEPFAFVVASANPHKVVEIRTILQPLLGDRVRILPRPESIADVEETGATLAENARLKARAICEATGLPAVADDTGLEVDALDGAPGVYSARYAGEHATDNENVSKLLAAMEGIEDRSARFRTVAVMACPDGRILDVSGVAPGHIGTVRRGSAGFGYDPVFIPYGDTRTYAEISGAEKHAISHRGRAFRALAAILIAEIGRRPGE